MLVVVVLQRELRPGYDRIEVAQSTVQTNAVAAWIQENYLWVLFRRVERNAVPSLVKRVVEAQEALFRVVAETARAVGFAGV